MSLKVHHQSISFLFICFLTPPRDDSTVSLSTSSVPPCRRWVSCEPPALALMKTPSSPRSEVQPTSFLLYYDSHPPRVSCPSTLEKHFLNLTPAAHRQEVAPAWNRWTSCTPLSCVIDSNLSSIEFKAPRLMKYSLEIILLKNVILMCQIFMV